ncbi:MAG: DUF2442 domain-containing protein [Chloroflexi bacterium]|nr:DUF2442 domain-containing protein [Chloroflexota bacterium]
MQHCIPIAPDILEAFCRRNHISRLSLFGSTTKGTSHAGSDIDLLVEFEPDCEPGLIGLAGTEMELSELLDGKKVDLRTPQDLSRYFRDEVLATAEVQYELQVADAQATNITISEDTLAADLADGRTISVPLVWYPRLLHGTVAERNKWEFIDGGRGIHWPDLDEHISVKGLLIGRPSAENPRSLQKWLDERTQQ